ncbi:MAG: arsenate reductase ArsC [Meiothermus sp.]|nr:arsenate reductase ArsC [Meiothermus sp.]
MRILVLCTHNSARSQMGEGWIRFHAAGAGLEAEVWSAGTEATFVKPDATTVMGEVGIDLTSHTSKTLYDLPDPWDFDLVITVCDSAAESCPAYPAKTAKLHVSFPDPSGKGLEEWRRVRDGLGRMAQALVGELKQGHLPSEALLSRAAGLAEVAR